jgi:uncharacterized membrane protein
MHNLKRNLIYWIPTILIALNWTFGGVSAVLRTESSREVFSRLGYPEYFAVMLGTAQLLGVVLILAPVPRALREWAYAGLTFDVTAAIISLLAIGTPVWQVSFPIVALVLVITSYAAWRGRLKVTEARLGASYA